MDSLTNNIPEDKLREIAAALHDHNKIGAIKIYRETTGMGLKESKEAIEVIEASLLAKYPPTFTPSAKGKGCSGAAALLLVSFGLVGYWLLRG